MKILVTGATGFIGRAFSHLALNAGHQIGAMILPSETPPKFLCRPGITWLKGSLAEPPWAEIKAFAPESCLHLAWIATPGVYLESPENEKYFQWGLHFVRKASELGTGHFCVAGTCVEYQNSKERLSESRTPIQPTTPYARWKNELRLALEAASVTDRFTLTWARIFYPYGIGEHPSRLCSAITQKLIRNEKIELRTPGSTKDYIYIEDLASAFLEVMDRHYCGAVNLGTGVGVSIRTIADTIGELVGKPELIEETHSPEIDPFGYVVADPTRLLELGWKPKVDLKEGLSRLVQNLTQQ
jgi:nucleoside-diphosphate-sugar epimerase